MSPHSIVFAIGVGNALEWFDFAIFGALADVIGFHFFPSDYKNSALLSSFSVYCSAFFMRPLGGMVMGWIGDKYGRKVALELSIFCMVVPSFLMGCLPTFSQIGYSASAVLIFLRLLQGLAVGGEMIGAYIYTIEACESRDCGYWGGVCKATALTGTVIGMAFVTLLRELLTPSDLYQWGWRIPFLSSMLVGSIGIYLRSYLHESEAFVRYKQHHAATLQQTPFPQSTLQVFTTHWPEIIYVIGITAFWCTGYYSCFIWMSYYMSQLLASGVVTHSWVISIGMISGLVLALPMGGILGDAIASSFG
jgi:MFS transporter, MHS family, proline/betaine transporter